VKRRLGKSPNRPGLGCIDEGRGLVEAWPRMGGNETSRRRVLGGVWIGIVVARKRTVSLRRGYDRVCVDLSCFPPVGLLRRRVACSSLGASPPAPCGTSFSSPRRLFSGPRCGSRPTALPGLHGAELRFADPTASRAIYHQLDTVASRFGTERSQDPA
jgi:hypothetical protein